MGVLSVKKCYQNPEKEEMKKRLEQAKEDLLAWCKKRCAAHDVDVSNFKNRYDIYIYIYIYNLRTRAYFYILFCAHFLQRDTVTKQKSST